MIVTKVKKSMRDSLKPSNGIEVQSHVSSFGSPQNTEKHLMAQDHLINNDMSSETLTLIDELVRDLEAHMGV